VSLCDETQTRWIVRWPACWRLSRVGGVGRFVCGDKKGEKKGGKTLTQQVLSVLCECEMNEE